MDPIAQQQIEAIREATLAILQTMGNQPTNETWYSLKLANSSMKYKIEKDLELPEGLVIEGTGQDLKIKYTEQTLSQVPVLNPAQKLELKAVHKEYAVWFVTILAVIFLMAWFYDILFKKWFR